MSNGGIVVNAGNIIIENSDIEDNQIRVTVENGAEKIPNLLNQLVSKDINVQSVSANKPSLDDVFLKVTGYSS